MSDKRMPLAEYADTPAINYFLRAHQHKIHHVLTWIRIGFRQHIRGALARNTEASSAGRRRAAKATAKCGPIIERLINTLAKYRQHRMMLRRPTHIYCLHANILTHHCYITPFAGVLHGTCLRGYIIPP